MSIPTVESHTRVSRYGMVNAFLVQEDDGLTLIDTADQGQRQEDPRRRRRPRRSDRPDRPHPCPRRPHRLARRARRRSPRCRGPDLLPRRDPARGDKTLQQGETRQDQGRLPRGEDEADADDRGRRTGRLARGDRDPRPHPGPPRLPRPPRPHPLLRRRLLDPVRRLHLGSCQPALPAPLLRDLGQGDRARERDRAAHPRAGRACARATARSTSTRSSRWTTRSRSPRRSPQREIDASAECPASRPLSPRAAATAWTMAGRAATLPRR